MRPNSNFWKESSSLIIVARNILKNPGECDYKVLVMKRTAKANFMPNSTVFPGGVTEHADSSQKWIKLYESLGVPYKHLQSLTKVTGARPPIFQADDRHGEIEREISVRISGIREAFEELGVLICKSKQDLMKIGNNSPFASYTAGFDVAAWQKMVHNDPSMFLELCQDQQVAPDIWGLHEWSAWLTPRALQGRRFLTAFFLVAFHSIPDVLAEINEVHSTQWKTPAQLLEEHNSKVIWLPPPQRYELSRLMGVPSLNDVAKFAQEREKKGTTLFYPIQISANDGIIYLLPGDAAYPVEPNLQDPEGSETQSDLTMEALRHPVGPIHRSEMKGLHGQTFVIRNCAPPNGHLYPVGTSDSKATSKL